MDNTLKILLGVLSVAGLITVVIPQGNPIAPREAADVANPEVTAPPPKPAAPPPSPPPVPFDSGASVEFITGAPTIDGKPMQADFGLPFGASPRSDTENPDAPALDEREVETSARLRSEPRSQGLLGGPASIDR